MRVSLWGHLWDGPMYLLVSVGAPVCVFVSLGMSALTWNPIWLIRVGWVVAIYLAYGILDDIFDRRLDPPKKKQRHTSCHGPISARFAMKLLSWSGLITAILWQQWGLVIAITLLIVFQLLSSIGESGLRRGIGFR